MPATEATGDPDARITLRLVQPRRKDRVVTVAVEQLEGTLRNLDWSGPLTVTGSTPAGVGLAVTADGRGGWRAVWQPGIDGVGQVATDLPEGTEDLCRAFLALAAPGSPLTGVLRWQGAPAEPALVLDEPIAAGADLGGERAGGMRRLVSPMVFLAVLAAWGLLMIAWWWVR